MTYGRLFLSACVRTITNQFLAQTSTAGPAEETTVLGPGYTSCLLQPIHYSTSSQSNYISRFLPTRGVPQSSGWGSGGKDPPGGVYSTSRRRLRIDWAWNGGSAGRHCVACRLYDASIIDSYDTGDHTIDTHPHRLSIQSVSMYCIFFPQNW